MNNEVPATPAAKSPDSAETHDAHTTLASEAAADQSGAPRPLGVLVGFDGSTNAISALRWAAREAHFRGLPLTVMSSYTVPPAISGYLESIPNAGEQTLAHQATEETLNVAREHLARHAGEVSYRLEHGDAAGVMVHLSGSAELCVVGSRGRGGFTGRILGSVAAALPAHAHSPTVVVPDTDDSGVGEGADAISTADTRPVAVGIDSSPHSRRASVEAARTAISHGTRLQLVMALPPMTTAAMWYPELAAREEAMVKSRVEDLNKELDVEVGWVQAQFPELSVTGSVEEGFPVNVMLELSNQVQLTVVGTRGHGGVRSVLLGSVSRELLYHATAPVMVVPAHD